MARANYSLMNDYRNFSYRPDYGFILKNATGRVIEQSDHVQWAACFSHVFSLLRGTQNTYHGTYTLRCRKEFVYESGNYCSLEKAQILKILRYMRKNLDIKIHLTDTPDNYVFVFDISGKPIKHKFVLTFSRVFFEFPYNEIAKDVLRLRAMGTIDGVDYTHKSFLELYHNMLMLYQRGWGAGHSLFYYPSYELPIKHLKAMFEKGCERVQGVYEGSYDFSKKFPRSNTSIYRIDWEDGFDRRAGQYSEKFKILRKLKQNEKGIRRRARKVVQ